MRVHVSGQLSLSVRPATYIQLSAVIFGTDYSEQTSRLKTWKKGPAESMTCI